MEKIKILLFFHNVMANGGIENFMMSFFREIDRNKFHFIFCQLTETGSGGVFDSEIKELGGEVEYLNFSNKHFLSSLKKVKYIIHKYSPNIIHIHGDADCVSLLVALRLCGVKNIISHSHNTNFSSNKNGFLNPLKRKLTSLLSDGHLACSYEAGKWLFGKRKFTVIKNAIDVDKFVFNIENREIIRKKYGINKRQKVVGCVGHLMDSHKNQSFIVKIAEHLKSIDNQDLVFLLVGGGPDLSKLSEYCLINSITNVVFVGNVSDTSPFYSAFDVFTLPSHYEGLGIACVEAICSGLECVISHNVPLFSSRTNREVQIQPKDELIDSWIRLFMSKSNERHHDGPEYVRSSGYDIKNEIIHLEEFYTSFIKDKKTK